MYRLGLNQAKSNNYMFFDFEAPLCLSVSNNTGVVERLTPSILSAIKSGTLILLEGEPPKKNIPSLPEIEVEKDKVETVVEDESSKSSVVMTDRSLHITFEAKKDVDKEESSEEVSEDASEEATLKKKTSTKRTTKKPKAE